MQPRHLGRAAGDPLSVGSGFVRGTASFGRHAMAGAANTATGLTQSVASGLLVLAQDDKYLRERRRQQRQRPRNVGAHGRPLRLDFPGCRPSPRSFLGALLITVLKKI